MARNDGGAAAAKDVRRSVGAEGEALAVSRLEADGWQIVTRNWRPHGRAVRGELDIVARDGDFLVFVEVRTRRLAADGTPALGRPEESVTPRKQLQLVQLAYAYLFEFPWGGPWRIDVVAIELARRGGLVRLTHYRDAVGG